MATLPAVKQFSDRVNRIEISATMAVVAEAAKLKANGADLVEFGAGEPHFPTPQHIKDAAIAAINNNCTRYTAVAGIQELRNAIHPPPRRRFRFHVPAQRIAWFPPGESWRCSMPFRCWWTTATKSLSLFRTGFLSKTSLNTPAANAFSSKPTRQRISG